MKREIKIRIYWTIYKGKKFIDEDSIREEFEEKLKQVQIDLANSQNGAANVFTDTLTGKRIQTKQVVEDWGDNWALLRKTKGGLRVSRKLNKKRFTWDRSPSHFTA